MMTKQRTLFCICSRSPCQNIKVLDRNSGQMDGQRKENGVHALFFFAPSPCVKVDLRGKYCRARRKCQDLSSNIHGSRCRRMCRSNDATVAASQWYYGGDVLVPQPQTACGSQLWPQITAAYSSTLINNLLRTLRVLPFISPQPITDGILLLALNSCVHKLSLTLRDIYSPASSNNFDPCV